MSSGGQSAAVREIRESRVKWIAVRRRKLGRWSLIRWIQV